MNIIKINEEHYPDKLRNIYNCPQKLYINGILPDFDNTKTIGIIGSRNASDYGKRIAAMLALRCAEHGINVVSGMAKGIDYYAGMGALRALEGRNDTSKYIGKSIAVLGCGLDICYPKENIELYKKLYEKGCMISEYEAGTSPVASNFPARNRIIAGLSDGLLVVEAGRESGTAITVSLGLEMGKQIFAVPGRICDSGAQGPNDLIKNGAFPVTEFSDIYNNL